MVTSHYGQRNAHSCSFLLSCLCMPLRPFIHTFAKMKVLSFIIIYTLMLFQGVQCCTIEPTISLEISKVIICWKLCRSSQIPFALTFKFENTKVRMRFKNGGKFPIPFPFLSQSYRWISEDKKKCIVVWLSFYLFIVIYIFNIYILFFILLCFSNFVVFYVYVVC